MAASYLLRLFLPAVRFSSYGHICLQADNSCSIDVNVVFVLCAQRCSFLLMNFFGVVLLFSVSDVDEVDESSDKVLKSGYKKQGCNSAKKFMITSDVVIFLSVHRFVKFSRSLSGMVLWKYYHFHAVNFHLWNH